MTTATPDNPIFAIAARAEELRAQGRDVIVLAAGEPDAPTAPHIVDAVRRVIDDPIHHHYGTASGLPALRDAVAVDTARKTEMSWSGSDVLITSGTKHALSLAVGAVTDIGDEVLVTPPGWPGHRGATVAAGPVPVDVPVTAEDNFLTSVTALESSWTPKCRVLIIASPANPTGSVYPREQLKDIAEWAERRNLWLILDDIYDAFVYEGQRVGMLNAAPESRNRCILVNGVSKAHAMTGWRVGWLLGPPDVVRAATKHVSRTVTNVPSITQIGALAALTADPSYVVRTVEAARNKRDRMVDALSSIEGIDCPSPDGGMYVFPSVAGLLTDNRLALSTSADLATWLLEEVGIAVVPGEAFGAQGRLRLCFAVGDSVLDQALSRLCSSLTTLNSS
ncbi:pyridoxal phosphate-dependent aminotransferase [Rhodococcus sp. B10]|uniref:pyridoxal phosphate-dependent aminotransferase n=1 Tax=Rhodococcus sp. B10 TaxID=2695876 RepID=UPI0014308335|nr:pyridoxal phosphate-dependent aminotransferase [Rhodococcus sp. B10]NIL77339.1 Aspartate aminotransferase [Rhodococcus sp. B10]